MTVQQILEMLPSMGLLTALVNSSVLIGTSTTQSTAFTLHLAMKLYIPQPQTLPSLVILTLRGPPGWKWNAAMWDHSKL